MNRRLFLGLAALLPLASIKATPKPQKQTWKYVAMESGMTAFEGVDKAKRVAAREGIEIRFEFNYTRLYCVHPDGRVEMGEIKPYKFL